WVDGVQVLPSADISPSILPPSASRTTTSVSLPLVAPTFSAPLVFTSLAPSSGAMLTTASDCLLRAAVESLPFASPAPAAWPDPPPPQAVTASTTPSASAASFLPARRPAPTDAPDIGPTFTLFSPRRAWPDPRP